MFVEFITCVICDAMIELYEHTYVLPIQPDHQTHCPVYLLIIGKVAATIIRPLLAKLLISMRHKTYQRYIVITTS